MVAVRRKQWLLVLSIFLFINLIFYILNIDFIKFPSWSRIPSVVHDNQDEIVILVRHLEIDIENYTRTYRQRKNGGDSHGFNLHYKLVVMVQSEVSNSERRKLIRSTWGDSCTKCRNSRWRVLFLTGRSTNADVMRSLDKEQSFHGDIIPVDTIDSLHNNTDKIKKGIQWIWKHFHFKYLMKTLDDVFVNIPTLYNYLDQPDTPQTELYVGSVNWWTTVLRTGIYGVGKEYKRDVYPRYCAGAAFVLSADVIQKFVDTFDHVPYLFIEDAYIGEVALKSGIDATRNKMFKQNMPGCQYNSSHISFHPVKDATCMMDMYQKTLPSIVKIYN